MTVSLLIADLVRAGLDPELVGRVAEALAAREPVPVILKDETAERRRSRDREYRANRNRPKSAESAESAEGVSPKDVSPKPPSEITPSPSPPSVPKGTSSPKLAGFDRFWEAYPEKTGKGAARKAFPLAMAKISSFDPLDFVILPALQRYRERKPVDRPWCNPATWLNQERWLDGEPVQAVAQGPPITPEEKAEEADRWRKYHELLEKRDRENGASTQIADDGDR